MLCSALSCFIFIMVHTFTMGAVQFHPPLLASESLLWSYQRLSAQGHLVSSYSEKKSNSNPFFPVENYYSQLVLGFKPLTFQCVSSTFKREIDPLTWRDICLSRFVICQSCFWCSQATKMHLKNSTVM